MEKDGGEGDEAEESVVCQTAERACREALPCGLVCQAKTWGAPAKDPQEDPQLSRMSINPFGRGWIKKRAFFLGYPTFFGGCWIPSEKPLEARAGIEPAYTDLQSAA